MALRTKLTWLVIGPVSRVLRIANGAVAWKAMVLPVSLSVIHTCLPSGEAAMFGQKGLGWGTRASIWWSATRTTSISGLNEEQT